MVSHGLGLRSALKRPLNVGEGATVKIRQFPNVAPSISYRALSLALWAPLFLVRQRKSLFVL